MGASFVESIERYFLDVVGFAVPGSALIALLVECFGGGANAVTAMSGISLGGIIVLGVVSYALGHIVIQLGNLVGGGLLGRLLRDDIAQHSVEFSAFRSMACRAVLGEVDAALRQEAQNDVDFWRNLAMSVTDDRNQLVHRFRQIANMNLGLATVLLVAVTLSLLDLVLNVGLRLDVSWLADSRLDQLPVGTRVGMAVFGLGATLMVARAYRDFLERSILLPFSRGIAHLTELGK